VSGKFLVNGTASLKRMLDLKLTRISTGAAAPAYAIKGPLSGPQVMALPGVQQARLKPESAKK
jgi:hypothetical protein